MAVTANAEKSFPRRTSNSNFITKRTCEGNFSDVQSDILINVDGVNFALHKFPLLSRSGRIRKLAAELRESDSSIEFSNLPGGADAFELAAKFCYGINFEITTENVAYLRCAAEYLEMTEEYGEENLLGRAEAFLDEVVLQSLEKSAEVLHACESILPLAEEVKLVSRCIDAIASKACREQMASSLSRLDCNSSGRSTNPKDQGSPQSKAVVEWWAEDLSSLRIDLYQRALAAMKSRGLRNESIGGSLMHYAQRSFKALNKKQGLDSGGTRPKAKLHETGSKAAQHEQRILVETIVSLLPAEKNIVPTNFLLGLLRTANLLDTTIACRLDLERRIGLQLEDATLDDLLIPAFSHAGDTLFDVDVVQRVLVTYLQQEENQESTLSSNAVYDSDGLGSPSQRGIMKVAKLVDMFLAEIAPDANLKAAKFAALAELLPDYARVLDDGLYRAIDIFLKAHPTVPELERKKICKLLDCQKLSQEACTHAAQNERLPVQLVVQVLYFEQLRMRNAMAGSVNDGEHFGPQSCFRPSHRVSGGAMSAAMSPRDNHNSYSTLRRENRELKLEVARMRIKLNELEKENEALKQELEKPAPSHNFFASFSRKLGRINPFSRHSSKDGSKQIGTPELKAVPRRRRHSIS